MSGIKRIRQTEFKREVSSDKELDSKGAGQPGSTEAQTQKQPLHLMPVLLTAVINAIL